MKKIVFASLIASSALLAGDFFVGIDMARESVDGSATATLPQGYIWTNGTRVASDSGTTYYNIAGLKAGYIFSEDHRVGAMYQQSSKQSGMSHQAITAFYSYTPSIIGDFRASLGAHAGYVKHAQDKIGVLDSFDSQGTIVGVNIGCIYKPNKNNEFEFGYRYSVVNMSDESVRAVNSTGTITTVNIERTDVKSKQIYLGYNYRF